MQFVIFASILNQNVLEIMENLHKNLVPSLRKTELFLGILFGRPKSGSGGENIWGGEYLGRNVICGGGSQSELKFVSMHQLQSIYLAFQEPIPREMPSGRIDFAAFGR